MKNQLENWEVDMAEKLQTKEFPFDPRAFAEFEGLLTAESAGTPERLADESGLATGKTASTFTSWYIKVILIGLVTVSGIGYFYGSRDTAALNAPPVILREAEFSVPAAKVSVVNDEVSVLPESRSTTVKPNVMRKVPSAITVSSSPKVRVLPTESLIENEGEVPASAQRKVLTRQTVLVHSLPRSAVAPLGPRLPAYKIPTVSLSGNNTLKPRRNRRTLFPDVIEH